MAREVFDGLFDTFADAVLVFSPDGGIIWSNSAFTDLFGWGSPQDVLDPGEGIVGIIHPDDREEALRQWRWLLAEPDRQLRWEGRCRMADGSWLWVDSFQRNKAHDPAIGGVVSVLRDISEQRLAEDRLLASEESLRFAMAHASDVVLVVDTDGRIGYVSPSVSRILGLEAHELTGRKTAEFIHPVDLDEAQGLVRAGLEDSAGAEVTVEMRMVNRPDGWRWMEATVSNAVDGGVPGGVIISLRDVHERKRAEDALRASEERFRALLQNSVDGVAVMDKNFVITWASSAAESILATPASGIIGHHISELVHPDDLDLAARRAESTLAGEAPGDPFTIRIAHGEQGWVTLEVAGSVMPGDDDLDEGPSVIFNMRDVGWRLAAEEATRRSDERFRALVERSSDVVCLANPDGEITWCSPAITHVLGHQPEDMMGSRGRRFVHPDDFGPYTRALLPVLMTPGASTQVGLRLLHADGTYRWFEETFHNLVDDPRVGGIVIHARDVSTRHEAEKRFRILTQASPTGIFRLEPGFGCTYVNERLMEILDVEEEAALGAGWQRAVHSDDLAKIGIGSDGIVHESVDIELRMLRPSGEQRWVALRIAPVPGEDGGVESNVGTIEDITERVLAERDSERLTDIFDATQDLVGIASASGSILYLNGSARAFLGLADRADLGDLTVRSVMALGDSADQMPGITRALEHDGMWSGELSVPNAHGDSVPMLAQLLVHRDDDGEIEFFSGVLHDISERKRFESELAHQATHDPLTGLPNRSLLLQRLDHALARARRNRSRVAVLFLDLDHFKVVNDSLGHDLGDQVLVAIASRLRDALRPSDSVARFGGDEFVVLCEDLVGSHDAEAVAERVHRAVSGAFTVGDREVFVGLSIGIAFPESAPEDGSTLIRDADAAMYQAKARGRSRWELFDHDMRGRAVDRLDIENALRRALDRRELRIHYQPMVRLDVGTVKGVEALLRWEHPERGMLGPDEFIRVAEETGLIVPIGAWVLEQACRQVQRWRTANPALENLSVSVNLSGRQLNDPGIVASVANAIEVSGLPPYLIGLEITESVLMDDVEMSEEALIRLKGLGVALAIDDFGTGYSSMSYLRQFPVDVLKVDRSFVDGLGEEQSDSAIVAAIVTLAHTLGLKAIAEGVETHTQLQELRRLGCDFAQGYLFSRPIPGEEAAELLDRNYVW